MMLMAVGNVELASLGASPFFWQVSFLLGIELQFASAKCDFYSEIVVPLALESSTSRIPSPYYLIDFQGVVSELRNRSSRIFLHET
jgi:hypothetical protein